MPSNPSRPPEVCVRCAGGDQHEPVQKTARNRVGHLSVNSMLVDLGVPMRLRTTGLVLVASLVAIALAVPLHDASASLGKPLATPINPSAFKTGHTSVGAGAVPVAGDFDGDGHADVFWYRPGPSADVMWWGTGS